MATVSARGPLVAAVSTFLRVESIVPAVYVTPSTGIVWPRPVSKLG